MKRKIHNSKFFEAEAIGEVEQKHLDKITNLISSAIGSEVVPRLIPFGVDENEQYQILDVIAMNVPEGVINFDLTHGFRHFGMIGFLSAFMLARVRGRGAKNQRLEVKDLWYGALEMTKKQHYTCASVRWTRPCTPMVRCSQSLRRNWRL